MEARRQQVQHLRRLSCGQDAWRCCVESGDLLRAPCRTQAPHRQPG